MKLQEIRREQGIEQQDLAEKVGTNAPMMSYIERYKCLPIPTMLKEICRILNCSPLDIYNEEELYISTRRHRTANTDEKSDVYRLTADLPNYARKILCSENLKKCGYKSLRDFIWHCFRWFEKKLKTVKNEKATKPTNCLMANENGHENELSHK